jgi:hypothetical protein
MIGRATLRSGVVIAATAGIRLDGAEVAVADRLIGDTLFAAVGGAVPLPRGPLGGLAEPVKLTGEVLGSLGDDVGKLSGPSPLEVRLGGIVQPLPGLAIGIHAGIGLDDQIGAPRFRAVLEVAFSPRVVRPPVPVAPPGEPAEDAPDDAGEDADDVQAAPGGR